MLQAMDFVTLRNWSHRPDGNKFRHNDAIVDVRNRQITIEFAQGEEVHIHFENTKALVRITKEGKTVREVADVVKIPAILSAHGISDAVSAVFENIPFFQKVLA